MSSDAFTYIHMFVRVCIGFHPSLHLFTQVHYTISKLNLHVGSHPNYTKTSSLLPSPRLLAFLSTSDLDLEHLRELKSQKNLSSSRCRFSQVPRLTCFPVASGLGNLTRCRWGRRRTNSSPLGGTHALLATSGLGQGAGEVLVRWGKKQHHGEKHCWGEVREDHGEKQCCPWDLPAALVPSVSL